MNKLKAFIALDSDSHKKNLLIVKNLRRYVYGFKIGYRSFYKDGNKVLIKEIKKKHNAIKIIVVSAQRDIDIIATVQAEGTPYYLVKSDSVLKNLKTIVQDFLLTIEKKD